MKNHSQMLGISIFSLFLVLMRFLIPYIMGNDGFTVEMQILGNIILILTYLLICAIYLIYRSFNYKLISQKLMLLVVVFRVLIIVCRSVSVYFLNNSREDYAKWIFAIEMILESFIPFLLLIYILSYRESSLEFLHTFPAVIIVGSSIGLISIGQYYNLIEFSDFIVYHLKYPLISLAILINASYFLLGIYILYAIFKSTNFEMLKFNPILIRQNVLIIIGLSFYFFVIPIIEVFGYFNLPEHSLLILGIIDLTQNIAILLIVLPNFYATDSSFNLIPQSVEKFVVMNNTGIPFISYDFGFSERVIHSDLLVTSSLSAIMTYLTHSDIITRRIENIKFQDRILRFKTINDFTFVIIVKRQTKVLDSAIDVFINEFIKRIDPSLSRKGYFKSNDLQYLRVQQLIEECFGTNFNPSPAADSRPIVSNNTGQEIFIGRLVIAIFLAISSQRTVVFQSSTVLLPEESNFWGILVIFLYACLIYLGSISIIVNKIRDIGYLFYVNVGIYLVLNFLSPGLFYALLTWVFAFLAWAYLIGTWIHDYPRINKETRYQLFILAIALDIGIRFITFGTEFLLFHDSNLSIFAILITGLIIFIDRQLRTEIYALEGKPRSNQLSLVTLSIGIFFTMRYSLNIGAFTRFFVKISFIQYTLITIIWISLILIMASSVVSSLVFKKYRLTFVVACLNLTFMLVLSNPFFNTLLTLISPLSVSYISSILDDEMILGKYQISSSIINLLHFMIPALMFSFIAIGFYGGSEIIILFPLFVFFILHTPRKVLVNFRVSDQEITAIALILLILLSFALPIHFAKHDIRSNMTPNLGVMTYNIQYGVNSENSYNPVEIADYVIKSGVSIIGLQEVTRGSLINGGGDLYLQIALILKNNGFRYSTQMESDADIFTNVLFSKYPIVSSESIHFPENVIFTRGLIKSIINVDGILTQVVVTHLTHVYTESANRTRISQINSLINSISTDFPTILMGDFNIEPDSEGLELVRNVFSDLWDNSNLGYTWPAENPQMRIDYIFGSSISSSQIYVGSTKTSDHLPVIAWFDF